MRTLYISHTGEVSGGAEAVLLQTMRAARHAGCNVSLVCPPGSLATCASPLADSVFVIPLPALERASNPIRVVRLWLLWLLAALRLALLILRLRPRLVHANSGVAALIVCLPAVLTRRPLIWQQHDIIPPRPVNRALLGVLVGCSARRVIACSRAVHDSLTALGVPTTRLRVHYNAVPSRFFAPLPSRSACRDVLNLPADAPIIGVIGRLVPNKGQWLLLEALAELRGQSAMREERSATGGQRSATGGRSLQVHVVIAGDVPRNNDVHANARYADCLRERASRPDVAGYVSFLGFQEDIRQVLGAIDVFVMPSFNDPFPLAILEAFASGVPVIASASGGHPEAVEDGVTGLLFAPGDVRDLADKIIQLLDDPALGERLVANARVRAEREYREDILTDRIRRLYAEVACSAGFHSRAVDGMGMEPRATSRPKLSVLVPCFNNEDIIEECLQSVRWADEVVVCDSFSTDCTLEIAQRYADRVLQHEYQNSASQKNWAIPQLTHDWVLIVDTDERVTPALREEIEDALAAQLPAAGSLAATSVWRLKPHVVSIPCIPDPGPTTVGTPVGYRIPRSNHLFGRWLRHGNEWPDYQIRLFQRDSGCYEPREVHAHVLLDGPCATLREPLLHYPHRSLRALRRTLLQRYTTWEALEKQKQGVRFTWPALLLRPPGAFAYRYVYKHGFRDGWQGLFMAVVWMAYVFIAYWKLHRLQCEN